MNSPVRSGTGHPWYHPGSDPAVRYGSALSRQLSVPSRPPWVVVTAPPHSAAGLGTGIGAASGPARTPPARSPRQRAPAPPHHLVCGILTRELRRFNRDADYRSIGTATRLPHSVQEPS